MSDDLDQTKIYQIFFLMVYIKIVIIRFVLEKNILAKD